MKNNFYNQFKKSVEELKKLVNHHGYFWSCNTDCDTYPEDFMSKEKQTFIDIADREIERLEENKMEKDYSVEAQDIDWSKHDIHNKALNQQISYWEEAKELITNHK